MSATAPATSLPTGTWQIDKTHSTASFAVKHMVVATFRGGFTNFDATLVVGDEGSARLTGVVDVNSISVKDENLKGHLGSPDFFDVERYPEIRFESTDFRLIEGEQVALEGDLTIKGNTHRVTASGTLTGPAVTFGDVTKIGVALATVVDRTQYGLEWNAPLPKGGFALANDVTLTVELELALEA
jgi:polyisoprenoid-binding protein YceI